jgi:GNAT superfamily N-acetyltransferase
MRFVIRPATVTDAEQACAVLRRSIAECCIDDHRNDLSTLSYWLINKTPENVATWFASSRDYSVVASAAQELIGVAMLSDLGEVELCYVLPESRFDGVGKALLRDIEKRAREWGLRELRLESTATGLPFYESQGFVPHGMPVEAFGMKGYPMLKGLR